MLIQTLNPAAQLDAFFNPNFYLNRKRQHSKPAESTSLRTPVDISEDKHAFYIHAELAGVKPSDVKVNVDKNILTISGKKQSTIKTDGSDESQSQERSAQAHLEERRFGEFSRSFTLPDSVDAKNLEAKFTDGILTLQIPKKEEDVQQSFEVKISS